MAPLYLLWPVLSLFGKNSANKEEIVYHRNVHYPNMLPEYADVNLTGFSNIGLVECSMKCLVHTCMGHTKCVGVFHNKEIQSCKLMSDNLVEGLVFKSQTTWEFFSVNPCEIGWSYYMNNCYYLSKTGATWENAKSQCIAFSAHLAEIGSIEENDWVVGTLAPTQCIDGWFRCIIWIGGNDRDNEGSFVWSSDNRALDFYNWSPVEPNSYTVDDDCIVIIYPTGKWADFGCLATRPFLCKKPLPSL